jgi:uncharacterized repeat protein (TIGR01451 family)
LIRRDSSGTSAVHSWTRALLLGWTLFLVAAPAAKAQDCSDYSGLIDGAAGDVAPAQLQIDTNCTIRNFPASDPLTTNFSFLTQPGQTDERWLIVFDNVVHTGQMACNSVAGHKIWFVNGSSSSIQEGCQNLLIPVEKIDKQNPPGQTAVAIGVPFTYTLTIPVLFDPATGSVINASGSPNDLHSIILTDDLNATGVQLTYLSHALSWRDTGAPVPHTFSNAGGVLTLQVAPVVPAGDQIVFELNVVLEDTPANAPGTQFVNTAKWEFGRLIDGVFYQPLPGEWGVSPPLTIAAPELVVTKTGPATLGRTLNLGEWGRFAIDVQNTGLTDAWDVTILDRLPDGATGGMCDTTPEILSARVFEADGTTPVSPALVEDSDFSFSYDAAPTCELSLTMLTPSARIGPGQRLIVSYRSKLDADSQDGVSLTNVVGATRWFNGDAGNPDRVSFTRTLTDGTVGIPDHEDAHTVTVAVHGYFFEKIVANLTTGANPAATAAPGDTLRYTLHLQTTDVPLDDLRIYDDLGVLNADAVFVPGSLSLVSSSLPPGADISNTLPNGGTAGAGVLDVRNLSAPANGELVVQFDIRVEPALVDGTIVLNQAELISAGTGIALSDDPTINGQADPDVDGDEDPTRVLIQRAPPGSYRFEKTVVNVSTGEDPATTATPGEVLRYRLRLENLGDDPLTELGFFDELDRLNDPPAFQTGTLQLQTVPVGADASNTSGTGGPRGTGVIDVRNLSLGAGESLLVEFEITLAPTLADGSLVTNQAQLLSRGVAFAQSDDPNVNGPDDPNLPGDEDPTQVRISSAPAFRIEKVSSYVSGDPNVLLAGETLRYTITVRNVGTDDAQGVELRDQIPVNTRYVPGSTTLNGSPLADGASGASPLSSGILLHAPRDPTPGFLGAAPSPAGDEVATVVFEVVVDPDVIDGTVISNQAFLDAVPAVSGQPSDDPRTPITDDPTRDVVGNVPLLFAAKDVALQVDGGTPGIVDPGDVLRYTITLHNSGSTTASGVVLTDTVPANTTWVADSLLLNGLPVGQPDGGTSPLIAGVPVSGSGLTPPLPGPGLGTLVGGATAVVEFSLRVDDGVPGGTLIVNQAVVSSVEVPTLLTDGDGNPTTGPEPTVVVVGDGQQLTITKQVAVVGGGPALPGSQLEYVVRIVNVGSVPAFSVVITDDLNAPTPGQLAYVAGSATLDGSASGVGLVGSVLSADYSALYGPLPPGDSVVLRFRATVDGSLAAGTTIVNMAVVTWNTPVQTASASVSVDVGGMPGVGVLSGRLWHDADFDDTWGPGERPLEGWLVDLYRNDQPARSVTTDADGVYRIGGLDPNYISGDRYELRFRAPDAGASSAKLGRAHSAFTDGLQQITDIVVPSGANLQDLNLPIDPNGVVYGALGRAPVAGATLELLDASAGLPLPSSCFDDPAQQGQVTRGDGYYKFDLSFGSPACPSGAGYLIAIRAPGSGFVAGYSQIIPPISDVSTPPFPVPTCPGSVVDAVSATLEHCEVQDSELAPPPSVTARSPGTSYHVHLLLDDSRLPGSSQLFNNHIPLDPVLDGAVGIAKTTASVLVSRHQLVPYEIIVSNELGTDLPNLDLVDRFPAGFRYVEGSARIGDTPTEPVVQGRELRWRDLSVASGDRLSLRLLLAVGAGAGEGEYVNRAQAFSSLTGSALSGEATATVRVVPDPTFSCTDVLGKVFDDANRNGVQDAHERGLPGVRLVTTRGLVATTDAHGRYHITCAVTPREGRGSNFILKLDDRTLPSGYRMSTRRVQVQRATSGKAMRLNYAASIHRVVGLDLADGVFEPGSSRMRTQWRPRIGRLLEELRKAPATLRLSYLADVEDERLVEQRLEAVRQEIGDSWEALDCCYPLAIEPEVFWLRGSPPDLPAGIPGER